MERTYTISHELACKMAEALLLLGNFTAHTGSITDGAAALIQTHPHKAAALLATLAELAEQAAEANALNLSAELCRVMDGSTAAKPKPIPTR